MCDKGLLSLNMMQLRRTVELVFLTETEETRSKRTFTIAKWFGSDVLTLTDISKYVLGVIRLFTRLA